MAINFKELKKFKKKGQMKNPPLQDYASLMSRHVLETSPPKLYSLCPTLVKNNKLSENI